MLVKQSRCRRGECDGECQGTTRVGNGETRYRTCRERLIPARGVRLSRKGNGSGMSGNKKAYT